MTVDLLQQAASMLQIKDSELPIFQPRDPNEFIVLQINRDLQHNNLPGRRSKVVLLQMEDRRPPAKLELLHIGLWERLRPGWQRPRHLVLQQISVDLQQKFRLVQRDGERMLQNS